MTALRAAAAALVTALALGACGGDEPAASPTAPASAQEADSAEVPDTCALLPAEEVARVTGLDLDEGMLDTSIATIATCTYASTDGTAVVLATVQAGPGTREAYSTIGVTGAEPLEGIGDEARYSPGLRSVDALVGERSLSVSVTAGDDPDAPELREQAEELAAILADAL